MLLGLTITLLSDTTFGRGDGVPGLVDVEVEHEAQTGLPLIRGTALKGLLVEECANLLWTVQHAAPAHLAALRGAASWLFGRPGSGPDAQGHLRVGPGLLPAELADAVRYDLARSATHRTFTSPQQVLSTLTTIRRQSSQTRQGAPAKGSLRSTRAVLRGTVFRSELVLDDAPPPLAAPLLAGSVQAVRRGGLSRNRGRGKLVLSLTDEHGQAWGEGQVAALLAALKGGAA